MMRDHLRVSRFRLHYKIHEIFSLSRFMVEPRPADHERRRQFNKKIHQQKLLQCHFSSPSFFTSSLPHTIPSQAGRKVFFREVAQAQAPQPPFPKLKTVFDLVNSDLTIFAILIPWPDMACYLQSCFIYSGTSF